MTPNSIPLAATAPALLLCLAVASPAAAQSGIHRLGEGVVTVDGPRVVELTGTVDEITAEDIQRSGARNLEEAIDLLPGLYLRYGADGTPRIDIRGLRTRNVLLLLDGILLNSTFDGQVGIAASTSWYDPTTSSCPAISRRPHSRTAGEGPTATAATRPSERN